MKTVDNNLIVLQIDEIFNDDKYIIPIYQRNYDWGKNEISQLIFDINDKIKENEDYYIGTLIVNDKGSKNYEVIDGQQRLTTIFLMLSYFKHHHNMNEHFKNNLEFESRPKSTKMLLKVFEKDEAFDNKDSSIITGYNIIKDRFNKGITQNGNKIDKSIFYKYLVENVKLLRVVVPEGTDLNHYFEIMNTRGEQLEAHEIIKAKMLSIIKQSNSSNAKAERKLFNIIWEASSDMESYVQYGFTDTKLREYIFGDKWNSFEYENFNEILEKQFHKDDKMGDNTNSKSNSIRNYILAEETHKNQSIGSKVNKDSEDYNSFNYIINNNELKIDINKKEMIDKESVRFTPVINFPNFLLHVLRVMVGSCVQEDCENQDCYCKFFININEEGDIIPLDDKRLIATFSKVLNQNAKIDFKYKFVKDFGYHLLKLRFLLDKYVIKREYTSERDEWSLKRLKTYENKRKTQNYVATYSQNDEDVYGTDENINILMLLSLFHVSNPSQNYKHWLTGVLNYLNSNFENNVVTPKSYIEYLEFFAERFLRERYLTTNPTAYDDIIFNQAEFIDINDELLNKGTGVENFIFNYLDYKLWKDGTIELKNKKKFRFSFKSSVEHFFPQTPPDNVKLQEINNLDNFGNLCLMSQDMNSRFTNNLPESKVTNFKNDSKNNNLFSLKQRIMFNMDKWVTTSDNHKIWRDAEIIKHGSEMKKILLESKDIDCNTQEVTTNE